MYRGVADPDYVEPYWVSFSTYASAPLPFRNPVDSTPGEEGAGEMKKNIPIYAFPTDFSPVGKRTGEESNSYEKTTIYT
jgi:hypothetical protein